jgi:hypothetical protein
METKEEHHELLDVLDILNPVKLMAVVVATFISRLIEIRKRSGK